MLIQNDSEYRKYKRKVKRCNKAYYQDHKSLITDKEYDLLIKAIETYEKTNNLTNTIKVGSDSQEGFSKSSHSIPMLSLDNCYNFDELSNFLNKIGDNSLVLEDKVDGLSLSLTYQDGILTKAVTRGDGMVGDDVTSNARLIIGLPQEIPNHKGVVEVRGEVYISKDDFIELNKDHDFANPRNLASGTLKLINKPEVVKKRRLRFIAYRLITTESGQDYSGQGVTLSELNFLGFDIPKNVFVRNPTIESLKVIIKRFEDSRSSKKYPIDGLVIKVNSLKLRKSLGESNKAPKWAIAYKFESEGAVATLGRVEFSVGRTGAVTPIAIFNPVELCGTIVKRASLHNKDILRDLNIHIGDDILIEKGGEIIPKVISVTKYNHGKLVKYPDNCPICGCKLVYSEKSSIICPDTFGKCTQFAGKLAHFASKDALDIQGLGEEISKQLVKELNILSIIDLFEKVPTDFELMEGFKSKSAFKLYKAIRHSLNQPMERWLFAMGIPGIGKVMALNICKHFGTWHKIMKAAQEDFLAVEGIGAILATNLYEWVNDDMNKQAVKYFKHLGFPRKYNNALSKQSNALEGRKIVITGSFGDYSRDFLSNKVEILGGIYHNSVKKDSTTLLYGNNTGKKKIEEATKKGLEVLSHDESLKLLKLI